MSTTAPTRSRRSIPWLTLTALVAIAIIAGWVARGMGVFDLWATVITADGPKSVVNTFASVDHPFHTTRSSLLLDSLRAGEILRWIPSHEGGYPVEFYPLGMAWLDVGIWAASLGQIPIIAAHKIAVTLIFLLPVVGFWILARGDRMNPFVPVLALAIHVAVPGEWTNGGRTELVYWGLISNVGGAALAFVMLAAMSRWVREGHRGFAVLATLAVTATLYTNTRMTIAIGLATIAVGLIAGLERHAGGWASIRVVIGRISIVAALSGLLTAPLLLSMLQYTSEYYFVNFQSYETLEAIKHASLMALSPVVAWFTIGGLVVATLIRRFSNGAIVALTLVLYVLVTISFSLFDPMANLIQQLETPRLMPFQRLLAIYLAAWTVGWLLERLTSWFHGWKRNWLMSAALATCGLLMLLAFYNDQFGALDLPYQQPPQMTTGVAEFADFETAVRTVDQVAPDDSAIMIVGDQESWWHEQLWAPSFSDAMFLYDDWMWFWHPDHQGPYNPAAGHAYLDPAQAFTREWFDAHGVGAVMVTNMPVPVGAQDPRHAAESNPLLRYQESIGYWDLYLVVDPVAMVTNGDVSATNVIVEGGLISASFEGADGEVLIRRNWFPRWEAWADGESVAVERTENGYMRVVVQPGTTDVELRYAVNPVDWLGRLAAIAGVAGLIAFAVNRPGKLWGRLTSDPEGSIAGGSRLTVAGSIILQDDVKSARTNLVRTLSRRRHSLKETDQSDVQ